MDEIDDALTRRDAEHFTRPLPTSSLKQFQELMRAERQDKAKVAARLGVTRRTVERYLAGTLQHPRHALREALAREVAKTWQPVVRRRARKQAAATGGITVETRARFGYTAPVGTSDDPRERRLTVHLPPAYAARLFDAQNRGETDRRLREIVAEGLQEVYFKDDGSRAQGLEVEFTDISYFDVEF